MTVDCAAVKPPVEHLNTLCDDELARVVEFLDFKSATVFSTLTCKTFCRQILESDASCYRHVWNNMFQRHGFAHGNGGDTVDYRLECLKRRQLFRNLARCGRTNTFSIPNRCFNFLPILPEESEDDFWDRDPPVDFDCPSFLLTLPATSGELLLLHPFEGSVQLFRSCLDNCVKQSDEGMMERAMLEAATCIRQKRQDDVSTPEEHYAVQPSEVLMDMKDYLQIDLRDYFWMNQNNGRQRRREDGALILRENEEVEIDFIGVDVKQMMDGGTVFCVGRSLTVSNEDVWDRSDNPGECTEMVIWKRNAAGGPLERLVCRIAYSYQHLEVHPTHNRVFINFPVGEGPSFARRYDRQFETEQEEDRLEYQGGSRIIAAYPFEAYPDNDVDYDGSSGPRHFPKPEFIVRSEHPVSSVVVDPSGDRLFVGTTKGTVEEWHIQKEPGARRVGVLNVKCALSRARASIGPESTTETPLDNDENNEIPELVDEHRGEMELDGPGGVFANEEAEQQQQQQQERTANTPMVPTAVTSIHHPSHVPMERFGFVTLHYEYGISSKLLLWKKAKDTDPFEVSALVNLPLSARRKPRIHYDGRRLIVFGQDHIGMIILVYHVMNSWEDLESFQRDSAMDCRKHEASGGVYNFGSAPRQVLRYANRIRHAALGGLEEWHDTIHMTANERFVVVNTRTGNLLGGGASPTTDGLLIIDLEDHQSRNGPEAKSHHDTIICK